MGKIEASIMPVTGHKRRQRAAQRLIPPRPRFVANVNGVVGARWKRRPGRIDAIIGAGIPVLNRPFVREPPVEEKESAGNIMSISASNDGLNCKRDGLFMFAAVRSMRGR